MKLQDFLFLLVAFIVAVQFHLKSPNSALALSPSSRTKTAGAHNMNTSMSMSMQASSSSSLPNIRKPLPKKILVGYTTNNCDDLEEGMAKVTKAIEDGVNVLIWCFVHFQPIIEDEDDDDGGDHGGDDDDNDDDDEGKNVNVSTDTGWENDGGMDHKFKCRRKPKVKRRIRIKASQNLDNFRNYKKFLNHRGFGDVVHLVAFGGWNGPHLPSGYSANELYDAFQTFNMVEDGDSCEEEMVVEEEGGEEKDGSKKERLREYLFDGIDWDLEGHDNVHSPTNEFTLECLDQMGQFSALAKENDGMIISMAPPESYLDITTPHFSRFVNLTYPEPWHQDFTYHGRSVYAYVLARWQDVIDFVFVQFYESYSHAAYLITNRGMDPSLFLWEYNLRLETQGGGWMVQFDDDPSLGMNAQHVSLPYEKLVFGFANGWALNADIGDKTIFFDSFGVKMAYRDLLDAGRQPRGLGFWVIEEEGKHGIEYAKDLNEILDIERLRMEGNPSIDDDQIASEE